MQGTKGWVKFRGGARMQNTLGSLADPTMHRSPLNLDGLPVAVALEWLRAMWLIRLAESEIADLIEAGLVKTPCHLGIGQEAIAVGTAALLRNSDRAFGTHRAHSQYLALGGKLEELFAEVLGRASGASKGLGGSMHLTAPGTAFRACVPIVAATIPIAVGAALAAKLEGDGNIAVAYFGDGAVEEGVFHESLNLAAVLKLPIVFVCENNLFASHLDISERQPSDSVARFAEAHRIPSIVLDGNDVGAVYRAFSDLSLSARSGRGPGFVEAVTYRWRGHVGPNEDLDVGLRRKMDELLAWKMRDPIARLSAALCSLSTAHEKEIAQMVESLQATVSAASRYAKHAPWPSLSATADVVYSREASHA
jgi:TPP-dependent pyruvate/acetoin dehydrogenase alpha subunit